MVGAEAPCSVSCLANSFSRSAAAVCALLGLIIRLPFLLQLCCTDQAILAGFFLSGWLRITVRSWSGAQTRLVMSAVSHAPRALSYLKCIKKRNRKRSPESLYEASIIVLLKPAKNPLECGSYRPIFRLNIDYKILTKILANRLNKVIASIIHRDQTGFIPGRSTSDNIRRAQIVAQIGQAMGPGFT